MIYSATFLVRGNTSLYASSCSWLIPRRLWAEASRSYPKSPGDLGPVVATTGTTLLHLPYKAKGFLQDIETGIFVPVACVATGRVCTPINALGKREIGSTRTAAVTQLAQWVEASHFHYHSPCT